MVGQSEFSSTDCSCLRCSPGSLRFPRRWFYKKIVAPPHSQEVRVERLGPFLFRNNFKLSYPHHSFPRFRQIPIASRCEFYYHGTWPLKLDFPLALIRALPSSLAAGAALVARLHWPWRAKVLTWLSSAAAKSKLKALKMKWQHWADAPLQFPAT